MHMMVFSLSILAVRYGIGSSLGVNSLVLKLLIVPGPDRRRPSINLTRSSTHKRQGGSCMDGRRLQLVFILS
jgi:hypothetical protein